MARSVSLATELIRVGDSESLTGRYATSVLRMARSHAARINDSLQKDGTESMTGPLPLVIYTVATVPASAPVGSVIYVSDAAAGSRIQAWDGAAWIAGG